MRLPAEQREVIVLHLMEGFSFREVGRLTGVSLFTAAARYRLRDADDCEKRWRHRSSDRGTDDQTGD